MLTRQKERHEEECISSCNGTALSHKSRCPIKKIKIKMKNTKEQKLGGESFLRACVRDA